MAQDIGLLLRGLGASFSNQVPQFRQELAQQREDEYTRQQRARQAQMQDIKMMQDFETASFQDALTLTQMLAPEVMNVEGALNFLEDRREQISGLEKMGLAIRNDPTEMLYNNLRRYAGSGDAAALSSVRNLAGAYTAMGVGRGVIKLPEAKAATPIAGSNIMETTQGPVVPMLQPDGTITTVPVPVTMAPKPDQTIETERNEARDFIRSNVTNINKNMGEITSAYNKVSSLEPQMRAGNRSAINAAIMNVARLISPGVVTDRDAAAFSGANTNVGAMYEFLSGKGVNVEDLIRIYDPANPRIFNPDALLSVARNVTASSIPALIAQLEDQKNIATQYNLSPQFVASFLSENSAVLKSVREIQQSLVSAQPAGIMSRQPITFRTMQEAESAAEIDAIPVGSTVNIVDANGRFIDSFVVE